MISEFLSKRDRMMICNPTAFSLQRNGWLASKPLPLVTKHCNICKCMQKMRQKSGPEKLKSQVNADKREKSKTVKFVGKNTT